MGKGRDILYGIGVAAISPIWGLSMLRTGKWRTDWAGRLGRVDPAANASQHADGHKTLLIHAVSVGEAALIRGLVDELSRREPTLRIVIASTTNTGYARAHSLYGDKHSVIRYPFDFSAAVGCVLDAVKPDVFATVELEVWPNMVDACEARSVPVIVVNGRLSERSYRGYRRFKKIIGSSFAKLSHVAAQTQDYADRFVGMGVPADRVTVMDTMKWDTAVIEPRESVAGRDDLAADLGLDQSRPIVVAGSTGDGEEKLLIESGIAEFAQLVLVPRKPERFDAVARLDPRIVRLTKSRADRGGDSIQPAESYSATAHALDTNAIYLVDTMGELRKAYSLADAAIVGRSFNGWGGSDPIEPVALGVPTVVGPDHKNFADAVAALSAGDGIVVDRDVSVSVRKLIDNREEALAMAGRGRDVVLGRQGATGRHATLILGMLHDSKQQGS